MSFFQSLLMGEGPYSAIWTLGDSNSRGNSDAVGTTPAAGTVYQWDAGSSNLRMITNLDLLEPVAAGAIGSQWPAAGTTYYNLTGKKPVFINTGVGGSAFFNSTPGFSWYTNDSLFSNAVTKVNNCLAYLGKTRPDLVIVECGINDAVQGAALSQTYVSSLVDRILTQYPDVRIVMTQPWGSPSIALTTYTLLQRCFQLRKWIKQEALDNPTVELGGDMGIITQWGGLQADGYHRTFTGNAFYGDKTMWGICQSTSLNKWTRSATGLYYNRISANRMGWINTLFNAWEAAGYLDDIDYYNVSSTAGFDNAGTDGWKNAIQDFGFVSVNSYPAPTDNVTYDGFKPEGSLDGDRMSLSPPTLIVNFADLSTDFLFGIHVSLNAVGATTNATQGGVRESAAGGIILIRQTGSSAIGVFAASTVETTNNTETRPTNGIYMAGRNGGTQELWKGATLVDSDPVAYVAPNPGANIRGMAIGNYNSNGTIQSKWAGATALSFLIKNTTINKTTWNNANLNFLSNWLTDVL